MTFWTKAAAKQKAFLLRLRKGEWAGGGGGLKERAREGEIKREMERDAGEVEGKGIHHLVQCSISFALVYTLQGPYHANDS